MEAGSYIDSMGRATRVLGIWTGRVGEATGDGYYEPGSEGFPAAKAALDALVEQGAGKWVELSVGDGWHRVSPDGEKWQYRLTEDHPWVSGEGADWLSPSVKAYRKGYEVGKQEEQEWGGQGELWGQLEEHFDLDGEDMDCAGDVAHWIITNVPSAEERAKLLDRIEDKEDTIEALRRNVKTYSSLLVSEKEKVVAAEKARDKAIAHDRQPYPTAEAYEKVCAALQSHKDKTRQLVTEIAFATEQDGSGCVGGGRYPFSSDWTRIRALAKELK